MPGPGPHMLYAMGTGLGLGRVSNGKFGPHHCLCYTINAFFGPDIGSFTEWVTESLAAAGAGEHSIGSTVPDLVHHPFYYILIFGLPFSFLYSRISKLALRFGFLHSFSGVPLSKIQCFLLIAAGSLSHFFLDHLFEENGHSSMYTWILSTGWWGSRAPINPDAVIVVTLLCTCLIAGFIYINRARTQRSMKFQYHQSIKLVIVIAILYCLWCASQIYMVNPRRPPVGEEADLGVLVFMAIYFFLPHYLCTASMSSQEFTESAEHLPMWD